MQTTRAPGQTQQLLTIGMPLVALFLSLLVVFSLWGGYQTSRVEAEKDRLRLRQLEQAAPPRRNTALPAAAEGVAERGEFLAAMNSLAAATGCRIDNLETERTPESTTPAIVRPVRTRLILETTYPRLRLFLNRLESAPRVYVVTELTLYTKESRAPADRATRLLTATLVVERYVTPALPTGTG